MGMISWMNYCKQFRHPSTHAPRREHSSRKATNHALLVTEDHAVCISCATISHGAVTSLVVLRRAHVPFMMPHKTLNSHPIGAREELNIGPHRHTSVCA